MEIWLRYSIIIQISLRYYMVAYEMGYLSNEEHHVSEMLWEHMG